MPHPRNAEPSVHLGCWVPQSIHDRLKLQAYSTLHGKIPPKGLTTIVSAALGLYFDVMDGKRTIGLPDENTITSSTSKHEWKGSDVLP